MAQEAVRADSATLTLSLDSLLRLPMGATYRASNGRAHVSAEVKKTSGKPAVVYIESTCDSLERLCVYYSEENERLSVANSHLRSASELLEERARRRFAELLESFLAGAVAGALLIFLIKTTTIKRQK